MPVPVRVGQARYARQDRGVLSVMFMRVVRVMFVRVFMLQDFVRVPTCALRRSEWLE